MREKIKAHGWDVLFGAALLIAAAYSLVRMTMPESVWNFGPQDLILMGEGIYFEANMVRDNEPGWYVDNSMEYGDIFVQSPAIDLPVGSYEVTIFYMTQGSGGQYSFTSEYPTYRVFLGRNDATLEPEALSKTMEINYTRAIKGFSVQTEYTGDGYLIVNGIEIQQTRSQEFMILCGTFTMLLFWLIWNKVRKRKEIRTVILCGAGIACIASLPLMMPYLYLGDDINFHLMRIEGLAEGLKAGEFPVRIQPMWMNGYGYPVSVFYGDGVLWIASALRLIGFPLQTSYKLYVCFINILTFGITWWSLKRIVPDYKIAIAGSAIYMLAPYRLQNIYARAALGEYTAMAFMPLILVGAYEIILKEKEKRKYSWLILTAGMTGIIQSHILTCEIVVIMLGITCLICFRRTFERNRLTDFIKAVLGTTLLNMEFLIPFLDYLREDFLINIGYDDKWIQTHGVFPAQLFEIFPHGFGQELTVGVLTRDPERSIAVGIVLLLALVLSWLEKGKWQNAAEERKLEQYCRISSVILMFMSTIWFPWDFLYDLNGVFKTLIAKLQFPWRLLGAASLMLTVLSCVILQNWKKWKSKKEALGLAVIWLGLTGLTGGYYMSTLYGITCAYVPDVGSISSFGVGNGEYVPEGVVVSGDLMPEGKIWHNELVEAEVLEKNGLSYTLNCRNLSEELQYVEIPAIYYRGYEAEDLKLGETITVDSGENGRVRLWLPEEYSGTVSVGFQEPLLWRISEIVTAMAMIGLIAYLLKECRNIKSGGNRKWIR